MNWTNLLAQATVAATALLLCSCETAQVSLDYQPYPGQALPGRPDYTVGRFINMRGEGSFYLGTVRTPIGAPIENVTLHTPVEEAVKNAFAHALNTRGMLASPTGANYIITGEILELYCQMIVRPYAYARVRVNVVKAGSGQIVFSRVYAGERQSAAYRPGSGSPVPLLRDLTSRALQDAVDRAVDDPELRSRTGGSGGTPRYVPGML